MTDKVFKCRKCRYELFTESLVLNAHGKPLFVESASEDIGTTPSEGSLHPTCDGTTTLWYLSLEEPLLHWISHALTTGNWIKGKLLCPKCGGRLGSFDFVTAQKCPCSQYNVPTLHVNKNRVDHVSMATQKLKVKLENLNSSTDVHQSIVPDTGSTGHIIGQPCQSALKSSLTSITGVVSPDRGGLKSSREFENDELLDVDLVTSPASASSTSAISCTDIVNDDISGGNCDHDLDLEEIYLSRRRRHKRVVSDCSEVMGLRNIGSDGLGDFVNVIGKRYERTGSDGSLSSAASSRTNSTEDIRPRNHGNSGSRLVPLSTSLLKKRYGHRRAQSMTVTNNRFDYLHTLQDDINEVNGQAQHADKKRSERPPLSEVSDPTIPEDFLCPVCLDLMYNPHSCLPCKHRFCESCLRQLTRTQPVKTKCPMCRQLILRCQTQNELTYLLKTTFPASYARRRKAVRKHLSKANPLPQTKDDFRHKLDLVMQSRLRGRRFREICRDHFIMTFFVYTGAVALLLGLFLLLILVCCKSLFFLFIMLQWIALTMLGFLIGAGRLAASLRPSLFSTTTEAAAANRVILSAIVVVILYRLWIHFRSRDRPSNHNIAWRNN